jgi:hypothetical protein
LPVKKIYGKINQTVWRFDMKRNVSGIIVVFVLVLLLSGCGGNMGNAELSIPATAEAQKPTEKATPTQAVAWSCRDKSNSICVASGC